MSFIQRWQNYKDANNTTYLHYLLTRMNQNWQSALTVALVSLPLGIALSIASGAGPLPGVITGIWACLFAGIFGGNHYNIIGAAGALSTILYAFVSFGGEKIAYALPLLAITTGFVILVIWSLRLEKYLIYIPSSVMYGFATGVAVLIAFGQINDALGLKNVQSSSHFLDKLQATFERINTFHLPTFIVFLISLSILIFLKKIKFKIPGAIIVSILGIIFGLIITKFNINLSISTLLSKFGELKPQLVQIPDITKLISLFSADDFISKLFSTSLVVASIAILETLITAKLADKVTKTKTDTRREVFGLGLANIASGLFGGLPATGVFIRSGLNIKGGANHRTSAILAGIFTGILAVVFLPFFQYIPMSVIAAILFNTAIGLIEFDKLHIYLTKEKSSFIICLLVAFVTIFEDASWGIIIGVIAALLIFVDKLSRGEFEVTFNSNKKIVKYEYGHFLNLPKDSDIDVVVYSIEGIMAYLDGNAHLNNLECINNMPSLKTLVIRMRDLFYIDLDGLDILKETITAFEASGKQVLISSVCPEVSTKLYQSEFFKKRYDEGLIFEKTEKALKSIGFNKKDIGCYAGI
jgi:sulfate permease, SulP family